jgi:hypothetical protein
VSSGPCTDENISLDYRALARLIYSRNPTFDLFIPEDEAVHARLDLLTTMTKSGLLGPVASYSVEDHILFLRGGDWREIARECARSRRGAGVETMVHRYMLVLPFQPCGSHPDVEEVKGFCLTKGGLFGLSGWTEVYAGTYDADMSFVTHKRCADLQKMLEKGVRDLICSASAQS